MNPYTSTKGWKDSKVDLSICVLTYEGEGLLGDCLQSILQQDPMCEWELLVVDNGSTTPVQLVHPGIRVIRKERNVGNIEGMNVCFREAQGEWVLFVANDVRLQPGCIDHLWAHRSYFEVIQPVLYQPDGAIDNVGLQWVWPGYGRRVRKVGPPYTTDAFTTTCFLVHRALVVGLGGFNTQLGLSHEDIDFALRMRHFGIWGCNRYCPEARAIHLMGQTIGRTLRKPLSPFYHEARVKVLRTHYRGLNYWTRRLAVELLDGLAAQGRL